MKIIRIVSLATGGLLISALSACTPLVLSAPLFQSLSSQSSLSQSLSSPSLTPQYYSPLENAKYVSKASTIVVRYGPALSSQNLIDINFIVHGSESGPHVG